MPMAAFIGTKVDYTDYFNSIMIETTDGRVNHISKQTFEYLYYRLNKFEAAMKEDCIEYFIIDPMSDVTDEPPSWFNDAFADMVIYDYCGTTYMVEEDGGEIALSPHSVILRNFKGELRYMEFEDFIKYYDIPGSEFIE